MVFAYRVRFCSSQRKVLRERFAVVAYSVSARGVKEFDHICVIAKGEDAHVIKVLREEVFGPKEGIVVRPC